MPWTVADVDSHKKGLSDKQKKQWVRIANSVLASCIKKGGSEESCAASAIKQASGVVNANSGKYSVYKNKQEAGYEVELKIHQEKAHLIVPVIMIVEGVLNGSHGPLLHLEEEFGKIPEAWNGIPVVINHPEEDGISISANSPEIIDSRTVGRVYNARVENKKLMAEVWLDEEKLNDISPKTLAEVNDNKIVEVSVGVFTEDEEEEGEYDGKHYNAIARNHRPDHLALLTEACGACSSEDGCGLRANEDKKKTLWQKVRELFLSINAKEQGYNELMSMIWDKLQSMNTQNIYHYCEELYDDYLIYSMSGDNNKKMYKQTYKIESGKIEFVGEPIEVHRKVEYVININKFKKEVKMAEQCAPCIKKKVDDLIANKDCQGRWTEDDREFLQTLDEKKLDKLLPITITKEVEKEVQVNVLSKEDQDALATYKKEKKAKREQMIKDIQDNSSKELWPDAALNGMDDDNLKRVFDSVKKEEVADYSLNGGVKPAGKGVEPLYSTGVEMETAKK
jgi:hypothetical protein